MRHLRLREPERWGGGKLRKKVSPWRSKDASAPCMHEPQRADDSSGLHSTLKALESHKAALSLHCDSLDFEDKIVIILIKIMSL